MAPVSPTPATSASSSAPNAGRPVHLQTPWPKHERHHPYRRPTTTTPTLPGMATLLQRSQRATSRRLQVSNHVHSGSQPLGAGLVPSFQMRSSSWVGVVRAGRHFTPPPTATLTPLAVAVAARQQREDVRATNSGSSTTSTDNSPAKTTSSPTPATSDALPAKTSRYLREMDRRHILMRIEQGEKQAALAKEYHVSRAAICNLNKHRAQVLSRNHEHPLAKHPKRRSKPQPKKLPAQTATATAAAQQQPKLPRLQPLLKPQSAAPRASAPAQELRQPVLPIRPPSSKTRVVVTVAKPKPPAPTTNVYEVRTRSVVRFHALLTRPAVTSGAYPDSPADIRSLADRLMTVVLEEALAWAAPGCLTTSTSSRLLMSPVNAQAEPMLRRARTIEPRLSSSTGIISNAQDMCTKSVVLLLDAATTLDATATAITTMLQRGVSERSVCLVTLSVASSVLGQLLRRFPSMKVVAAHIGRSNSDAEPTPRSLLAERLHAAYADIQTDVAVAASSERPGS